MNRWTQCRQAGQFSWILLLCCFLNFDKNGFFKVKTQARVRDLFSETRSSHSVLTTQYTSVWCEMLYIFSSCASVSATVPRDEQHGQTQWLWRIFGKQAAVCVGQRPGRPPTRKEGLWNAFYWIACLVAPPHQTYSVFVCVRGDMCQERCFIHYQTERSVFSRWMRVCVQSLCLFAWTWIFHVHCGRRWCGFELMKKKKSLTDRLMTAQIFS